MAITLLTPPQPEGLLARQREAQRWNSISAQHFHPKTAPRGIALKGDLLGTLKRLREEVRLRGSRCEPTEEEPGCFPDNEKRRWDQFLCPHRHAGPGGPGLPGLIWAAHTLSSPRRDQQCG